MADSSFTVELHEAEIAAVTHQAWFEQGLRAEVEPRVERARARAPRRTGAGARSIHAEFVQGAEGWEAHVSWDKEHEYMHYQHSHAIQEAFGAQ
jgi:hypothetical protein